jgi:hypothetical protein
MGSVCHLVSIRRPSIHGLQSELGIRKIQRFLGSTEQSKQTKADERASLFSQPFIIELSDCVVGKSLNKCSEATSTAFHFSTVPHHPDNQDGS